MLAEKILWHPLTGAGGFALGIVTLATTPNMATVEQVAVGFGMVGFWIMACAGFVARRGR
jgi:hypothetical protein